MFINSRRSSRKDLPTYHHLSIIQGSIQGLPYHITLSYRHSIGNANTHKSNALNSLLLLLLLLLRIPEREAQAQTNQTTNPLEPSFSATPPIQIGRIANHQPSHPSRPPLCNPLYCSLPRTCSHTHTISTSALINQFNEKRCRVAPPFSRGPSLLFREIIIGYDKGGCGKRVSCARTNPSGNLNKVR